jgi:hypothetical protein
MVEKTLDDTLDQTGNDEKREYVANGIFQIITRIGYMLTQIFQMLFRKGHISDYDLMDLDVYLAKRMLPKFEAYRHNYIHRKGCREIPGVFAAIPLNENETCNIEGENFDNRAKAWIDVMDDIIFALRWTIYGSYNSSREEKNIETKEKGSALKDDAEERTRKGLILMGKHFRSFWY